MTNEVADRSRRRFLTLTTTVVGGLGVAFAAWPFIASWNPSAKAQAIGAPVEADISKLEPGQRITVQWRGKPVWVVRRTESALESLTDLNSRVRDPDSEDSLQPDYAHNEHRSIKPEYLVLVGLCTHLGCSPSFRPEMGGDMGPDWKGGFFCPCHGSRFDMAGRVYAGVPAPTNLEVPPHSFITATTIMIGVDQGAA
ncbi:MAG: ubiquinol-cytochrome c reductase iron-sulfur subunit [Gammaproteobacteria bacterium]|nr:ubiquinol-cytochrome c reductase iron-sulfur subunit [Gammaproteobacteria bacterium]MDJ0892706.1 ubiquinol-cytochrome c reductase iron-sulfur subunit [Gammaproteobacteria bacterium]